MNPELKQTTLDLLERTRQAVEAEDHEALQKSVIEALAILMQTLGKDIPDMLPMVILELQP